MQKYELLPTDEEALENETSSTGSNGFEQCKQLLSQLISADKDVSDLALAALRQPLHRTCSPCTGSQLQRWVQCGVLEALCALTYRATPLSVAQLDDVVSILGCFLVVPGFHMPFLEAAVRTASVN
eukprot:RCo028702